MLNSGLPILYICHCSDGHMSIRQLSELHQASLLRQTNIILPLSQRCYLMPRLHQESRTCRPEACCILDEQLVSWYMSTDTCRRIQVVRSGYLLTVSRRHNYHSLMSRSTCILCILQQQTGDKLATVLSPIQDTCRRRQVDTTCIRQRVFWCKRGLTRTGDSKWHNHVIMQKAQIIIMSDAALRLGSRITHWIISVCPSVRCLSLTRER